MFTTYKNPNDFQNYIDMEWFPFVNRKDIPVLDLKGRRGVTDYIDFLEFEDLKYPIMRGTDFADRKFIVIKSLVCKRPSFDTIFQRYSDDRYCWVNSGINCLINTCGGMKLESFKFIKKLVENGKATLTKNDYPTCEKLIGKIVVIDNKVYKACRIIEEAWLRCKFDPNYEMCKRLKERELIQYQEKSKQLEINSNDNINNKKVSFLLPEGHEEKKKEKLKPVIIKPNDMSAKIGGFCDPKFTGDYNFDVQNSKLYKRRRERQKRLNEEKAKEASE